MLPPHATGRLPQVDGFAASASRPPRGYPFATITHMVAGRGRRLPDARTRELAAGQARTNRHHPDCLAPRANEGYEVPWLEHILEDEGTGRIGDCRTNNEPRPLPLRQRLSPGRCRRVARRLVLGQPSRCHGHPLGAPQAGSVRGIAVEEEATGAGAIDVGRLVNGELTGPPNHGLDWAAECSVLPHTRTNALAVPAFGMARGSGVLVPMYDRGDRDSVAAMPVQGLEGLAP